MSVNMLANVNFNKKLDDVMHTHTHRRFNEAIIIVLPVLCIVFKTWSCELAQNALRTAAAQWLLWCTYMHGIAHAHTRFCCCDTSRHLLKHNFMLFTVKLHTSTSNYTHTHIHQNQQHPHHICTMNSRPCVFMHCVCECGRWWVGWQ